VSHPIQPVMPLPTVSLLLFLLRPPVDHLGEQRSPSSPPGWILHTGSCGIPSTVADRAAPRSVVSIRPDCQLSLSGVSLVSRVVPSGKFDAMPTATQPSRIW
jgi:hypothetical protein